MNELTVRDLELILECLNIRKMILINDFSIYETEQIKSYLGAKMNRILSLEKELKNYKSYLGSIHE